MPKGARMKGDSGESVEIALSGSPLTPTKVPRLVNRYCDAESDTESKDGVGPTTSNLASGSVGDDPDEDTPGMSRLVTKGSDESRVGFVAAGVACIEINRQVVGDFRSWCDALLGNS